MLKLPNFRNYKYSQGFTLMKKTSVRSQGFTLMKKTSVRSQGFTLIELLIVIALVAIISSLGIYSFGNAQKKARDANRKSDLTQFRSSLESYANKNNGLYPVHASPGIAADVLCSTAADLNLSFTCPVDPKNGTSPYGYKYIGDGLKYLLYAALENPTPSTNTYIGLCSNGITLAQSAVPTLANCP